MKPSTQSRFGLALKPSVAFFLAALISCQGDPLGHSAPSLPGLMGSGGAMETASGGSGGEALGTGGVVNLGGSHTGSGGDALGGKGPGRVCEVSDIVVHPAAAPTVYLLIDRSLSMFEPSQYWQELRDSLIPLLPQVDERLRLGFGSFTGNSLLCSGLQDMGAIELGNAGAIKQHYEALTAPEGSGETPTELAVRQANQRLSSEPEAGGRHIFLITDGAPDFCDNGNPSCGIDALIYRMQQVHETGVQTHVFGTTAELTLPVWFDYFAQAGTGQHPSWSAGVTDGQVAAECAGRPGWKTLQEESGASSGMPLGEYSEQGGSAKAFSAADAKLVGAAVFDALQGLVSCTFSGSFEELQLTGKAQWALSLSGQVIASSDWQLSGSQEIELLGEGCRAWRQGEQKTLTLAECEEN